MRRTSKNWDVIERCGMAVGRSEKSVVRIGKKWEGCGKKYEET